MSRLANTLLDEGKEEKAVNILDMALTKLPVEKVPHNYFSIFLAEGYYKANQTEKADEILTTLESKLTRNWNTFLRYLRPNKIMLVTTISEAGLSLMSWQQWQCAWIERKLKRS